MPNWQVSPIGDMFDLREPMDNYSSRLITDNIKGRKPYEIEVTATELIFEDREVGYGANSQKITITNKGFMIVPVNRFVFRGDTEAFSVNHLPRLFLLPGQSMQVVVSFRPRTSGDFTATLEMDFGKYIDKQVVVLTGSGHLPYLRLNGTWRLDGSEILDGDK